MLIPVALAALIVLALGAHYWPMLPVGNISQWDEYFTLERASSFAIHDDWFTVYTNHRPSYAKPPLQYWLTAPVLSRSESVEFALRLWPFLFALGLLGATGLLAYAIYPANPYVIPAAVVILAGSDALWSLGISALLETGAAFFLTLALAAFLLALRKPKWWYAVGLAAGLGALHKVPAAFVVVVGGLAVIGITGRFHELSLPGVLRNLHFRISALVAIAVYLWWPALQTGMHGIAYPRQAFGHEILTRFTPTTDLAAWRWQWVDWLIGDAPGVWIPALVALAVLPFVLRRAESLLPPLLVAAFGVAMTLATGKTYERYVLLVLPLLAAGLVVLFARMGARGAWVVLVASALTLVAGQPLRSVESLNLADDAQSRYTPLLRGFAAVLQPEETPVFCWWEGERPGIVPGAYGALASHGRSFVRLAAPDLILAAPTGSVSRGLYRGLCSVEEFQALAVHLDDAWVIEELHGQVHWLGRVTRVPGD